MTNPGRVTSWSNDDVTNLLATIGYECQGEVALVGSGHWSDCFGFTAERRSWVVRIGSHVEDFRKDQFACSFATAGLRIPEVVGLGPCGSEYFAVSERVFGEPLEAALGWSRLVTPLADLLEELRRADVSSISGWGRWSSDATAEASSWRDFLLQVNEDPQTGRLPGWTTKLAELPEAAAAFDRGYAMLQSHIVDDVPRSLVHNDLFNRNVHVANDRVSGVFDWGNSLIGDHLYDLALLTFWSPWWPHIDDQLVRDEMRRRWKQPATADLEDRLRVCLLHTGLEHIGYHAYLDNEPEALKVASRMETVIGQTW